MPNHLPKSQQPLFLNISDLYDFSGSEMDPYSQNSRILLNPDPLDFNKNKENFHSPFKSTKIRRAIKVLWHFGEICKNKYVAVTPLKKRQDTKLSSKWDNHNQNQTVCHHNQNHTHARFCQIHIALIEASINYFSLIPFLHMTRKFSKLCFCMMPQRLYHL